MKTKWIFCWLWLVATVVCSGMDSESHKSVKVPTFSGKANDHQAWWMRFSAHAAMMGFSAALATTKMANLPDTEAEGANDTNDQKKAREMHNKARCHLILAMLNERWLLDDVQETGYEPTRKQQATSSKYSLFQK